MALSETFKLAFQKSLIGWFKENGRKLPWRETRNPYHIWVSEIILQQTQVKQGWDYYLRFIETFPDIFALAKADDETLLRVWQGLGYYSRAHNLRAAAGQIVQTYGGIFPTNPVQIANLKGIGPYTTAAIASIAFGLPLAVVDGNVYRVLSRLLGEETPIDTTEGRKLYAALAEELLDREEPSAYNQAIMDFGAMVCTPRHPSCDSCPVAELCQSRGTDLVELLPQQVRKTAVREEELHFYLLQDGDAFAIEKRDSTGIWKGLYQLPLLSEPPAGWSETEVFRLRDHRLTHRLLHISIHKCIPTSGKREEEDTRWTFIPTSEHPGYAFPKPIRSFLDGAFPE